MRARRVALWVAACVGAWLLAAPFVGWLAALLAALGIGLALAWLSRTDVLRRAGRAPRGVALLCAGLVAVVAFLDQRVLVANPSDNAYLLVALLGYALVLPAALFALAAIAPFVAVGVWASRAGVVLVYLLGVLGAVPVPFVVVLMAGAPPSGDAGTLLRNPVAVNHVLAGALGLLLIWLVTYCQRGAAPVLRDP